MEKQDLINLFQQYARSPFTKSQRELAANSQYNRHIWQLYIEGIGAIRISKSGESNKIIYWKSALQDEKAPECIRFNISSDEFNELKQLYFSNVHLDPFYCGMITSEEMKLFAVHKF